MNSENSKNTILQCALKLFGERGYESVGISEITLESGITKPTLYYFFQSKEGVFLAILENYYQNFNNILSRICVYEPHVDSYQDDIFPVLKHLILAHFSFAQENTSFYLMLLSLSLAPPTAHTTQLTKPYITRHYTIVTDMFRMMAQHHHNLKGKETDCSCYLIAMINAAIGFWYQGLTTLNDDKATALLKQFMHGIMS